MIKKCKGNISLFQSAFELNIFAAAVIFDKFEQQISYYDRDSN